MYASGWTDLAPLVREQTLLVDVLAEIRQRLPFLLLGLTPTTTPSS
jgi:hypothetical protein